MSVQPGRDYKVGGPGSHAAGDAVDDEDNLAVEVREAAVDAARHGERLDKALVAMVAEFSRSHLQSLIAGGHVRLDGQLAQTASRRVQAGQVLRVELVPPPESLAFQPEAMVLPILFEDEHLLVIDKPAGMVVHPAAGNWSGTLMNGLLAHHKAAAALPRAGIVHRLDKDTSGLMVVGKTLAAVTSLVRDIAARAVSREYLALAQGLWKENGTVAIEAPIGRDPKSRVRMAVLPGGKPARTDVTLIAARDGVSAVRCKLHTGRTHQIRVHMASRGHPLLADATYGGPSLLGLERQALHAAHLGLAHPVSGQALSFEAPLPSDLAAAWDHVVR